MSAELAVIDNRTILTATGGYLGSGFTHTINPYQGCAFAHSLCGCYCYAQHNSWITKGRPWALYGVKRHTVEAYNREYDALKRPQRGPPKPLRIFLSSSTEPYPPQEHRLRLMQGLLHAMLGRPPDRLVLQTHGTLIARDLDVIIELSQRCPLRVSLTVETDIERLPGFPNHASSLARRLATLQAFRRRGVPTQAAVSPLLPLADPEKFARDLAEVADRVILDHYLIGDGSQGLRTKHTRFPQMLAAAGFDEWTHLDKLWEVRSLFERALGPDRVLISCDGFNAP
jgi:DNA repair photolyase